MKYIREVLALSNIGFGFSMAIVPVVFALIGFYFFGHPWIGLGAGLLCIGITALWSILFGIRGNLRRLGASPGNPENADITRVKRILGSLVEKVEIAMPEVWILPSPAPNAFATKLSGNSVIGVTSGLLLLTDDRELEGVLAHEIGHLLHKDTFLLAWYTSTVNLLMSPIIIFNLLGIGEGTGRGGRMTKKDVDQKGALILFFLFMIVVSLISILLAQLFAMAALRQREFAADALAKLITKDPLGVALALKKISNQEVVLLKKVNAVSSIFTVQPHYQQLWFQNLFDTHPDISERIRRLESPESMSKVSRYLNYAIATLFIVFIVIFKIILNSYPYQFKELYVSLKTFPLSKSFWEPQILWSYKGSFYKVAYSNKQFIAVDNEGNLLTSPNGSTWALHNLGMDGSVYGGVTYGKREFVAVAGGNIFTSPNGVDWTFQDNGTTTTPFFYSIAFGNGKFVAVGQNDAIRTSVDGVNWTTQTFPWPYFDSLYNVTYYNGRFVAIGQGGTIVTSTNGDDWILEKSFVSHSTLSGVSYGNGKFIAVGANRHVGIISTSADGVNWTMERATYDGKLNGIAYYKGEFVAVGCNEKGSGFILSSDDGISWTAESPGIYACLNDVTNGNNKFVVVGDNGTILIKSLLKR